MKYYDNLWINARLVTMSEPGSLAVIDNGAIATKNGLITLVKPMDDLSASPSKLANQVIDVDGKCITPGLIDCHTHLVYGGNRVQEFEMRLKGQSYQDIARQGGGIISTVTNTRNATEDELELSARNRLTNFMRDGVTTIEIKSGYGLSQESERKMLRVARRLGNTLPVNVKTTFLGAHTLPPEYKDKRADYIELICQHMLPQLHSEGLIDAVDAFCETIAFNTKEVEQVFKAATSLGIRVKLHAEQLSNSGGAVLASKYNALSVDHLEHLDENGVKAMSDSGTVAVLLPGAFFMLQETQKPPLDLLRKYKIPIALATDSNPGSSPVLSARLMMVMGCQVFAMTPEEALLAMTINAAKALGLEQKVGSLETGKAADMVIWNTHHPAELSYWVGGNLVHSTVKDGIPLYYSSVLGPIRSE